MVWFIVCGIMYLLFLILCKFALCPKCLYSAMGWCDISMYFSVFVFLQILFYIYNTIIIVVQTLRLFKSWFHVGARYV